MNVFDCVENRQRRSLGMGINVECIHFRAIYQKIDLLWYVIYYLGICLWIRTDFFSETDEVFCKEYFYDTLCN